MKSYRTKCKYIKKIVIAVFTCVLTSVSLIAPIYAEDAYSGSGSSQINGHVYSSYTVEIPAVIEVGQYGTASVRILNANLETNYSVKVYCGNLENGALPMTHTTSGSLASCDITSTQGLLVRDASTPIAVFQQIEITDGTLEKSISFNMVSDNAEPGDYTGTMTYTFQCESN